MKCLKLTLKTIKQGVKDNHKDTKTFFLLLTLLSFSIIVFLLLDMYLFAG